MSSLRVNRLVILVTVTFVAIGGPSARWKFWKGHTGGQGATAAAAEFVQAPDSWTAPNLGAAGEGDEVPNPSLASHNTSLRPYSEASNDGDEGPTTSQH